MNMNTLYSIEIYEKRSNKRTASFLCDREEIHGTTVDFYKNGEHVMFYDIRQCYHTKKIWKEN